MGGLNLAVNCAGVGWPKRLVGKEGPMPGEFFRKVVEINLVGTLLVCKAAAAAMQKNTPNAEGERGAIVMTASVAAFDGQIGQVAYAASKGGVVGMTLPMARELACLRHPRRHHRAGPLHDADDGGACRRKRRNRSASRCRSRRGSAGRRNSRSSCGRSSRTRC